MNFFIFFFVCTDDVRFVGVALETIDAVIRHHHLPLRLLDQEGMN